MIRIVTAIAALAVLGAPARVEAHMPATAASAAAAQAKGPDIVATAQAAGQFTTLAAALSAADLVEALQGEGPFTVFAPTDEAFRALPVGAVERLLQPENKAELVRVLTYHVVAGEISAADLAGRQARQETLAGPRLRIDGRQGVTVENARVIAADVRAGNGIIHVIDRVLLPPARTH